MLITADLKSNSFVEDCFIKNGEFCFARKDRQNGLIERNRDHNLPAVANLLPTFDL